MRHVAIWMLIVIQSYWQNPSTILCDVICETWKHILSYFNSYLAYWGLSDNTYSIKNQHFFNIFSTTHFDGTTMHRTLALYMASSTCPLLTDGSNWSGWFPCMHIHSLVLWCWRIYTCTKLRHTEALSIYFDAVTHCFLYITRISTRVLSVCLTSFCQLRCHVWSSVIPVLS